MKRLIVLLFVTSLYAQTDLPGPVGALPVYGSSSNAIFSWDKNNVYKFGFKAGTLSADLIYTGPNSDSAGCFSSNGSKVISIVGCGSSAPFFDNTSILKNFTDSSKQAAFDLSNITTGTTRTYQFQNASYIIAGKNIDNSFSTNESFFNTVLVQSFSTTQPLVHIFGTASQNNFDVVDIESASVNVSALSVSATVANTIFPTIGIFGSQNNAYAMWVIQEQNTGAGIYIDGCLSCTPTSGFPAIGAKGWINPLTTNSYGLGTSGARWGDNFFHNIDISGTCTGCGLPAGKKQIGALSSFNGSGFRSITTTLSTVDYIIATLQSAGTPTEYVGYDVPSGGTVGIRSSNTSSSTNFYWVAVGNP